MTASASKIQADVEGFLTQLSEPARIGSGVVGNDIADLLTKIKEWAAALNLDGMAKQALDIAYHYALDILVPKLREMLPTYGDLIMDTIALPLLKKLHDAYLHAE